MLTLESGIDVALLIVFFGFFVMVLLDLDFCFFPGLQTSCCFSTFGAAMRIEMKCFDCFFQFDKQPIFLHHTQKRFYFRQLSTKL